MPHPSAILALERVARALDPGPAERDRLMAHAHAYAQRLLADLTPDPASAHPANAAPQSPPAATGPSSPTKEPGRAKPAIPTLPSGASAPQSAAPNSPTPHPPRPAFNPDASAVPALRDLAPGRPRPFPALLDRFDASVARPGLLPSHPGHLGYIPGGGLYASALADYLAAVTNEYAGVRFVGPGSVVMEDLALDWLAGVAGYPETADGTLCSGGSVATLAAVVTAREAAGLRARDYERAVLYTTPHMHHCLDKAIRVAGMGDAARREVAVDDRLRMRPGSLARLAAADRARGLLPWLVAGSAGTADTGAIDPLEEIAGVARREGLWFHVDAAYGGFFAMLDDFRSALAGMERSDSLVLDPHKGMFLPYGTGAVLVRDGRLLRRAHAGDAAYMQDAAPSEAAGRSPSAVSPELTRHFRALRLWLPLLLHGEEPFRACLREKLELARHFHRRVAEIGFEVGPPPQLTVVPFRKIPARGDANAFNRALMEEIHRDGRVFMSSTTIDGNFVLRMVALAFRTHLDTIELALEILAETAARLEAEPDRWAPGSKPSPKGAARGNDR